MRNFIEAIWNLVSSNAITTRQTLNKFGWLSLLWQASLRVWRNIRSYIRCKNDSDRYKQNEIKPYVKFLMLYQQ
jgi:hypothetical protein